MPQWMWFAPLAVMVVALGLWGFRLGWIAATLTETDVIDAYTAHYVGTRAPDARATDCTARPGSEQNIWIIVRCAPATGEWVEYPVDRWGRLVQPDAKREPVGMPQI